MAVAWLALILGGPVPDVVPAFARQAPGVESGPPVFAFNGKDLDGFVPYTRYHEFQDPDGVFTVHDGLLHVSGREFGGLATRGVYSDYRLVAEWRWGKETWHPRRWRARNSGIMVHCSGPEGEAFGAWMESVECQILEGGTGDLILVPRKGQAPPRLTSEVGPGPDGRPRYRKGGRAATLAGGRFDWWGRDPAWRDVLSWRGPLDVEAPVGDWNWMEVICDGDKITCLLNGLLVNAGSGSSLTAGKILVQSEGAEIFFRKIEVRPLRK